jgi:uncharacterized membrane protein YadS
VKVTHALLAAVALLTLLPFVPAAAALAGGIAIAVTLGNPLADRTKALSRKLLPLAVIGLGGAMDLSAVLSVGARGLGYTAVGITLTFALGLLLTRGLAVTRR